MLHRLRSRATKLNWTKHEKMSWLRPRSRAFRACARVLCSTPPSEYDMYLARTLAPFVPTPQAVIESVMSLLDLTSDDQFYDLGCGDGRVAVAAARWGAGRAVGIESEELAMQAAHDQVAEMTALGQPPLLNLELRRENLLEADLSSANALYTYLSPAGNAKVGELLLNTAFAPGAVIRVVTCAFPLPNWDAREVVAQRRSVMGLDLFFYRWQQPKS